MKRVAHLLLSGLLLFAMALSAVAETDEVPERRLDLESLRSARTKVEGDATLTEDLRTRILGLYDAAISSFESKDSSEALARRFKREQAGVGRLVEALREELNRPDPEPRALPEDATQELADSELERERSRLKAYRSALRDVERVVEERAARRNEISRRLGGLDQEIESINDEMRSAAESDAQPELKNANRSNLLARREAANAEIDALRAELDLLEARQTLTPWRIDKGQRRVEQSERIVALLETASEGLRHREARESLQRVHEQSLAAAALSPALAGIATETEQLAEMLWGPVGVVSRSEVTSRTTSAMRKSVSDLDRIIQLTRRKFDAFGHRGSIQRWWPEVPDDFPEPGQMDSALRQLERETPEVQHQLIRLEQQRSAARELSIRTLEAIEDREGEADVAALKRTARDLLDTRRDLLDHLIQAYGRYSNQLIALEAISRGFAEKEHAVRSFLWERLLWVRSVPKPIIPRPRDLGAAFVWLNSWQGCKEASRAAFASARGYPGVTLAFLLALALLIWGRRPIRRRMETLAGRVANPATDSYGVTLEATLHTALLAAPVPLALFIGSLLLQRSDQTAYVFATSDALYYLASIAALLELIRQMLAPNGLAEAHFGWPSRIMKRTHVGLLWREIVFLPLIYVAIMLGMAGMRLDSPDNLQAFNNSLGRLAFIIALTFLGVTLLKLFGPKIEVSSKTHRPSFIWLHRIYMWAYPAVFLATVVPVVLAVLGFYITGFLLAYQMLRTIWLLTLLLIFNGLLLRWRRVIPAATTEEASPAEDAKARIQVQKLSRFAVVVVGAIGLWFIWSQADPTLRLLKRVQIFPRIAIIETVDTDVPGPLGVSAETAGETAPEGTSQGESVAPSVPGTPIGASGGADDQATTTDSAPLTLWHLLEAIIAVVITVVLVTNIPGLVELTLRRRTRLDGGARIALATLVRYTIIIVGVSVAFGLLGVSWGKIQWLAAALTFGLGFGLQEIVANFVSGLILLVERPVRVGDAVTVGNLQGIVSRIQIRATTITLWDRSEMVVPNKEFITTKLINWTLSDSQRRISIPLRVAYGADLDKVRETLVEVARENPNVVDDPAPHVLLLDFGDDALKFELRAFVDFGKGLSTQDGLRMAIDRAFKEKGIEFALPKLDLHVPPIPKM